VAVVVHMILTGYVDLCRHIDGSCVDANTNFACYIL
jgi:hypothetical protein